jgi:hypothetical protein
MRICNKVIFLFVALSTSLQINAQRLKADVEKEVKISSVELDHEGQSAGPNMFFNSRKYGMFGLTVSSKVYSAIWNPGSRTLVTEKPMKKVGSLKKQGFAPVKFTYLEGKPAVLVRKSSDKEGKRIYLQLLDNNLNTVGRRPFYIGRGKDCPDGSLLDNLDIITDPNTMYRGYLSNLSCTRGAPLQFSYIALDTAGKTIFEKKFRMSEDYNIHDGELVVYNDAKAFYALIHKGSKGKYHESNGIYEITEGDALFFPLEIDGYVVRDYTVFLGVDDNIHLRGLISKEGSLDILGIFSLKFSIKERTYKDLNIQQFDGEALEASLMEKKRIKPRDVDPNAPVVEYMITSSLLDRNGNMYLFSQNIESKYKRIMQVASGTESVIRHNYYRDILVTKISAEGKLVYSEIVPSSNVYTNYRPHRGYSYAFHEDELYIVHPSYNGDIAHYDIEGNKVTAPHTLQTHNNGIAVTIINKEGAGTSKTVYELGRKELYYDPAHVLYDPNKSKIFVLARRQSKRRYITQLSISLPKADDPKESADAE